MPSLDLSSKIPVAIIGGGSIAPYHAKYILTSPTCELVAVIDPYQSGRDLATRLSVSHFDSVSKLLASPSSTCRHPELYYICTPSGTHVQIATEVIYQISSSTSSSSATSPKVILVEKPLSTDSTSGQSLLDLASSKNCIIAAGHHRRFHPAIRAAKKAITSGKIGHVTAISGMWTCKKPDGYFDVPWRRSRAQGGGVVWTNFVHDIDLLHYLVGATVRRVWVTGTVSRRSHSRECQSQDRGQFARNGNDEAGGHDEEKDNEVEEGAAIMFHFTNGVVGTFVISDNVSSPYAWEMATGENPLMPKAELPVDTFRVFGTSGTLSVPDNQLWTYNEQVADQQGIKEIGWNVPMVVERLKVPEGIPFRDQLENLACGVKGTAGPVCTGEDGLAAVKVCEAIVRAVDRGDGTPMDIE